LPQFEEALGIQRLATLFHIVKLAVHRFGLSGQNGLTRLRFHEFAPGMRIATRMQYATTRLFLYLRIGAISIADHNALVILQVRMNYRMLMPERPMEYIVGG
jgi:hypothetical protein